jgi:hypothetical protein
VRDHIRGGEDPTLEARGYALTPADESGQPTKVTVREETLSFRLAENLDWRERPAFLTDLPRG